MVQLRAYAVMAGIISAAAKKRAFDLLVIGAGSGGVRAARIAAGHGARVGLCELQAQHGPPHYAAIGGTCVNVGCVPKKLMMYGSQFPRMSRLARSYGWGGSGGGGEIAAPVAADWREFMRRKDLEISRLNRVYTNMLKGAGVELLNGRGSLVDPHTVRVGDELVAADKVLIAVGAWPAVLDIPGSELTVTSNEMFYLERVPERLTIVGGGYIAAEFASIMSGYGSAVTLVHRGDQLLRGFDADIRAHLGDELRRSGVDVRLGRKPLSVTRNGDGSLKVSLGRNLPTAAGSSSGIAAGGVLETVQADVVLRATGRVPNTAGLGLAAAGVELDAAGAIVVDETSCTTAPGRSVFAVGDVTNRMNLTPIALHEGA